MVKPTNLPHTHTHTHTHTHNVPALGWMYGDTGGTIITTREGRNITSDGATTGLHHRLYRTTTHLYVPHPAATDPMLPQHASTHRCEQQRWHGPRLPLCRPRYETPDVDLAMARGLNTKMQADPCQGLPNDNALIHWARYRCRTGGVTTTGPNRARNHELMGLHGLVCHSQR